MPDSRFRARSSGAHRFGCGVFLAAWLLAMVVGTAPPALAQSAPSDPPSLEEIEAEAQQRKAEATRKAIAAEAEAQRRSEAERNAMADRAANEAASERERLAKEKARLEAEKARFEAERARFEKEKARIEAGHGPPGAGTASPASSQSAGRAGMVEVPAGEFLMGCNEAVDSGCFEDEKPSRRVNLAAFWIDRTEVTVAAYQECVAAGKCTTPHEGGTCNSGSGRSDHPVNCVDWSQAVAYCGYRGKRLPSEAEWEKAARGTDGRKYPWGNAAPDCSRAVIGGCGTGTQAAGGRAGGASPYGALDMAGNVWEWTSDPDSTGTGRSVRGGSWYAEPRYARASTRNSGDPASRPPLLGFRCAQ